MNNIDLVFKDKDVKKPMPLLEFRRHLLLLVKNGQWELFRLAVQKRKNYFRENPTEGTF